MHSSQPPSPTPLWARAPHLGLQHAALAQCATGVGGGTGPGRSGALGIGLQFAPFHTRSKHSSVPFFVAQLAVRAPPPPPPPAPSLTVYQLSCWAGICRLHSWLHSQGPADLCLSLYHPPLPPSFATSLGISLGHAVRTPALTHTSVDELSGNPLVSISAPKACGWAEALGAQASYSPNLCGACAIPSPSSMRPLPLSPGVLAPASSPPFSHHQLTPG